MTGTGRVIFFILPTTPTGRRTHHRAPSNILTRALSAEQREQAGYSQQRRVHGQSTARRLRHATRQGRASFHHVTPNLRFIWINNPFEYSSDASQNPISGVWRPTPEKGMLLVQHYTNFGRRMSHIYRQVPWSVCHTRRRHCRIH